SFVVWLERSPPNRTRSVAATEAPARGDPSSRTNLPTTNAELRPVVALEAPCVSAVSAASSPEKGLERTPPCDGGGASPEAVGDAALAADPAPTSTGALSSREES